MTVKSHRLRILFFEAGHYGGSVRSTAGMLDGLARHGCDVGLVSYYRPTGPVDLFDLGCIGAAYSLGVQPGTRPEVVERTFGVPHPTRFALHYLMLSLRALSCYRPDVVYLNNGPEGHLPALAVAKLLRVPVVSHLRGSEKLTRLDKLCSRYVDQFIVLTHWARRFFHSQGIPLERLRQSYNPFSVSDFDNKSKDTLKIDLDLGSLYVIQVGKLSAHKRPDLAIEAFAAARPRCPTMKLLLAGDGPMRGSLVEMIKRRGLQDSVLLLGNCAQIPSLLARCNIGLLVSKSEGQPNCVMEYMAAGLPVVTWNMPAIDELVVDGKSGLIARQAAAEELAELLVRLYHSVILRDTMGRAGRASLDNPRFNRETTLMAMNNVLAHLAFKEGSD